LGSDLQKRLGTDVDKLKADPCRLTEDQFEPVTQKILNKVIAAQIVQAKELQVDSWDKAEDIVIYFLDDGKFMEINFDALLYYKTF
jgi:predicted oxidoreductase (fatty acid repression mutant protein)